MPKADSTKRAGKPAALPAAGVPARCEAGRAPIAPPSPGRCGSVAAGGVNMSKSRFGIAVLRLALQAEAEGHRETAEHLMRALEALYAGSDPAHPASP